MPSSSEHFADDEGLSRRDALRDEILLRVLAARLAGASRGKGDPSTVARIAVFDPFSGASGDMLLGALVDAGASIDGVQASLDTLGIDGLCLASGPAASGAIQGTRVRVDAPEQTQSRQWRDIRSLIELAPLEAAVRDASLAVFA